ncbi:MAG: hypothetical protein AAF628_32385 [Planctomycetota bacterium]
MLPEPPTTPRPRPGTAPVFRDTFALCTWLLDRLEDDDRPLARSLCDNGLRLLDAISLAVRHREVDERLAEADDRLVMLRVHLRLAEARALLASSQAFFALGEADRIGRQLGGWLRSLEPR